jgi:hypothetical protein
MRPDWPEAAGLRPNRAVSGVPKEPGMSLKYLDLSSIFATFAARHQGPFATIRSICPGFAPNIPLNGPACPEPLPQTDARLFPTAQQEATMNTRETEAMAAKTPRWLRGVIANARAPMPALPFERSSRQTERRAEERSAAIAAH